MTATLLQSRLIRSRLLGDSTHSDTAKPSTLSFALGEPGRPAEFPTLLIVLADDSGSVASPIGADPVSNRYREARCAFQTVARNGGKHELGAVLHFDTPTSSDVPPTALTRFGLRHLNRGLQAPCDAAGTSLLAPALAAATRTAEVHPNHRATLVVLSDFELFDPDPAEVLSNLAAFPGEVHAIVLGAGLPEGVLDPRIAVTQIKVDDAPGAVARAVFASLTGYRPGAG